MSEKNYNVGVVGYGWAATAHIPAINACENAQVTAIYSSRPLDAEALSKEYGSPIKVYNDFSELIADDSIDVVDLTSYPQQHKDQAVQAAQAGKHLIIEKPLALSLTDVYHIRDAVKLAGVQACVCFEVHYSNQFLATKSILKSGILGEVHYGEIDYYHGVGPWYGQYRWNIKKSGGGSSLLSAGCHAMDILRFLMGAEVESVSSYQTQSKHEYFQAYEYPTTSVTIMKFADGRIGKTASVLDCFQPYYFHTHLVGSKGSLLDNKIHSEDLSLDKSKWSDLSMKMVDSGDVADHPYQTQFESYFSALQEGKAMEGTSLDEAIKSHEVIFAADLSAEKGEPVRIADIRQ
jgi:UDP-N-acetyl-2-amino-2-deoxyglucuronate dehydrogenase